MKDSMILQGWRTIEPSAGFAERVLAACDTPCEPTGSRDQGFHRWLFWAGALAAAATITLLMSPSRAVYSSNAPVASTGLVNLDLGSQPD